MKERPILSYGHEVRAILARRRTMLRRVVKADTAWSLDPLRAAAASAGHFWFSTDGISPGSIHLTCPYGEPGDRLWVRENFWRDSHKPTLHLGARERVEYDADLNDLDRDELRGTTYRHRPSIHMPRWASRLTLEITSVRVERLQLISEADAIAEGWPKQIDPGAHTGGNGGPFDWYRAVWESINGPGSWDANPWVWVLTFKRMEGGR